MKNYLRIIITVTVFVLLACLMWHMMSVLDLMTAFEKTVVSEDAGYISGMISSECGLTDDGEFILFAHSDPGIADTVVVNKKRTYSDFVRHGLQFDGFMSYSTVYTAKVYNEDTGFTDSISFSLSFRSENGSMKITSIEVSG